MGGWHGAGPVNELNERGELRKVGEGAVDAELLIQLSSLHLPENPPAPSLLIVGVTVIVEHIPSPSTSPIPHWGFMCTTSLLHAFTALTLTPAALTKLTFSYMVLYMVLDPDPITAQYCLSHSPLPVIVVRPSGVWRGRGVMNGEEGEQGQKRSIP
ncbi:hypothetical protein K443DRAFT_15932 [Laccaria amethystina LaAM-08-1]|uniref:Uncharacterized protein n=1 Tax=Laccaria amethystina LaAM-08-1 TaxID=1095629 RepID=A0A0C9WWF6_9AGAR|nr:hypothetical protein K443DRAFT_15932 [Laccaria amethystina LaAM-08-1]